MNRRNFLKQAALTSAGVTGFPAILHAKNRYPTIKVLGTHVTLQEVIRQKAMSDLKINIEFYPGGSAEVLTRAISDPSSFDVYEQWSNSARLLWNSGAIQAIDSTRLKYWDEINALPKTGVISENSKIGLGDSPNKVLYIQDDLTLAATPTDQLSFMPYVHNVDSFGYNSNVITEGVPYKTESWGWLLDDSHRGRVAIVNEPTIGLFDLALAVQAKGLMRFADIGNMSRVEIESLFTILDKFKKQGHFRGFWNSVPHSVDLMMNNEVDIQSMFSPGVTEVNGQGIPCIYAAPKEGYRAWYGVMSLSSDTCDERKDAAYEYMNWWLSGWAGAFIARQGYYISNPERSRPMMSQEDWDYWYAGKPAANALKGVDGKISVAQGSKRRGGSYQERFENVAVWNTVMPNFDFTLKKWSDFIRDI